MKSALHALIFRNKKILYSLCVVWLTMCVWLPTFAQNQVPSNAQLILSKIRGMKDDTNKVKAYFIREHSVLWQNRQTPDVYNELTALAKKLSFHKALVQANINQSNWYLDRGAYLKALKYAQEALVISQNESREQEAEALWAVAEVYFQLQDFEKSVVYNQDALNIYQQKAQPKQIGLAYCLIARSYDEWKKFDKAFTNLAKSIFIANKLNDKELQIMVYSNASWHFYLTKEYLNSYQYGRKVIDLVGEDGEFAYGTLGTMASIFLDAPDSLFAKMGIRIGERYEKALFYHKKALEGSLKSRFKPAIRDTYFDLHRTYKHLGDYKQAYEAYQKYVLYRDSATNSNQQMAVSQNEANQREGILKYEQRITQAYYIGGIIVLLIISFFISRNYFTQKKLNKIIRIEKQRSDDLLHNILPEDVAEELKANGKAQARQFDPVTVLFTDFVKFTTHSEMLSPQELVDELNHCFSAFDHIMSTYGLEKIKTIGDAYLAVSGLPNAQVNHGSKAVRAALAIRDFMIIRKQTIGEKVFDIRIGLHSGSVVAGIVGVKKFAYDIWGDTVNTAARMEQHSVPSKINISEDTMKLLQDEFTLTYRGEISAKNKGLLKMYFVEHKKSVSHG